MVREIDVREAADRVDDVRRDALQDAATTVSDHVLPGEHRVRVESFDPATGNAAVVTSQDAAAVAGDYVARALKHLQRISPALGLAEDQAPEYVADANDQTTSSGAVAVHLRQFYKGIPIYDAAETVRFDPDGRIAEVAGRSVTVAGDLQVSTTLTPGEALETAARHVAEAGDPGDAPVDQFGEPMVDPGLDLSEFDPVVRTGGADRADRVTTFDAPPFPHAVTVALMWFQVGGGLRLGWHTKLAVPGSAAYRVIVDANDGTILLATRLTNAVTGTADAVLVAGAAAEAITMPRPLASYGAPVPGNLPAGFPDHWLVDQSTKGASVHAVVEPGAAATSGSLSSGAVVFSPPSGSNDFLVVNLFTLCSSMHDLLYLLGFREADGNFQTDNRSRGGRALDPVLARVHPGAVWGTANMGTPPDGSRPTMNMGLVTSTNRHTALDPDVVFHEYTHGLTNRLVGGPLNDASLDAVQSGGMGEGWSDFFACIALGKTVVGDWVVNRPLGIRKFRYDETFPDTYADLGTGRYVGDAVHNLGEIWCATLMSLARQIGAWTAAQVVVDGLKLTAANPSFLGARDGILMAADQLARARGDSETGRADFVHSVWQVFARYGMGPGARTDGAETLTGIVADFQPPPRATTTATVRASATPALAVPDNAPAGIVSAVDLPTAGPIRSVSVTVDITHTYIGDLTVAVTSPSGLRVPLHTRAGGSTKNLAKTWQSDAHAGLAALVGASPAGTWTLSVADLAVRDVGTLNAWSIEATVGDERTVATAEASPGLSIPDNKPSGIKTTLDLAGTGTISALDLEVDITHTYVSDLEVTLTGPDGTKVKVHQRTGGSSDNIITTYSTAEVLAPFVGKAAGGTWTLLVADRAGQDIGKLNRWKLTATL